MIYGLEFKSKNASKINYDIIQKLDFQPSKNRILHLLKIANEIKYIDQVQWIKSTPKLDNNYFYDTIKGYVLLIQS